MAVRRCSSGLRPSPATWWWSASKGSGQVPESTKTSFAALLLDEIASRTAAGERVLVFLRHTRTQLPRRLLRLVQSVRPVPFGSTRRRCRRRAAARSTRRRRRSSSSTPNAVRTGLNNLVGFSTGVWYELDYSADTYRQAIGRLHRDRAGAPGHDPDSLLPGHRAGDRLRPVARKVSASLQVDGLDAALSLGKAVYRALRRAA